MKILGVIPARYAATRFPGKVLAPLQGRPILEWVVRAAEQASSLSEVLVATDDSRVRDCVEKMGVEAIMTDPELSSGTDRIYQAVKGRDYDAIVNVQGDEPLVTGDLIDQLVEPLSRGAQVATLACALEPEMLENKNRVKVILNADQNAIYFSRFPIPHSRKEGTLSHLHLGLYTYTREALERFCHQGPCEMELAESLEQLRFLWLGMSIAVSIVPHYGPGVDSPEDLAQIEEILEKKRKHGVKNSSETCNEGKIED